MERNTGLRGYEACGLELDVPGSLRCLADQIETGEIKDFVVVTLNERSCPESMVICREDRTEELIQAVVGQMNIYLEEQRITH